MSNIICPGCNQRITSTDECGGIDEGICAETALAEDIDRGKGIRESLVDFENLYDEPHTIPSLKELAAILDAHDAAAAQRKSVSSSRFLRAHPLPIAIVLKGWSIGWSDEISASAAVHDLEPKNRRRRLVVMTQDDHEPRDPNAPVELGLYELTDEDEWVQIHYEDFDTPADAVKSFRSDPAWA